MKKLIISILLVFSSSLFAQNMRQNAFSSLFSDQKATQVGDAITVLVVESSQASNNAETSTDRASTLGLGAMILKVQALHQAKDRLILKLVQQLIPYLQTGTS